MEQNHTETTTTNAMNSGLTNREMAAILFNIATLLKEGGNQNPYRTAAYERGARALMALPTEARETLQTQATVPFRRAWRVGNKLQAKINEMARRGRLIQYDDLLADLDAPVAQLMQAPGVGPKTARRLHEALGVQTVDELMQAARNGQLQTVRGFGPRRVAHLGGNPNGQLSLFS